MGRRNELVGAAFRRVAEVGSRVCDCGRVAADVGTDHSTLHHHVATKEALITAVAEYAIRQFGSTMPGELDPAAALRGHLAALRAMFEARPELFMVTAELDLRARRDPAVRALMDRYEAGWRKSLRELLARGAEQGTWPQTVRPDALVELVIAAVKGARLTPAIAAEVFDQLDALLTPGRANPTTRREQG